MPILFNQKTKEFHLYNSEISYILNIMKNNQLGQLYFGKKIKHRDSFEHLFEIVNRSLTAYVFPDDNKFSLEELKQEYPSYGTTDFRYPAFEIHQENGSKITNFEYVSHEIFRGKKKLESLPATYVEEDNEATTLEITLRDSLINTEVALSYTIYENLPVITRHSRFINCGDSNLRLTKAMSLNLDLPDYDYEMVQLSGAWSRERHIKTRKLEQGIQSIYSLRGASSPNHNPFIALKRPNADEHNGDVYGFSLVYSGNFLAQVEVDTHSQTRVSLGINPYGFEWHLNANEEFQTPEAVMVYSSEGLNKMSQIYHTLYRTRLARGYWRDRVRPILINNWEATKFSFNEEKILDIAKSAADVGIELFVLDDGWFGARNDDYRGLGDWYVNLEKLPDGISGLSKKVEELGLKFGLWVELEMVNKDSDLYRAHPDWIISAPNRFESHARHQNVLDFSRNEVVDYIYEMIAKVIRESSISYIKWDMNRYMSEPYSKGSAPCEQGKVMHKYILGVYDLYTRLTTEFPHILFESCASGGARFDPAMLYFAPQTWCSDDTDASERTKIQYGTSYVYPIVSMGSHVSAVPNHQMHRITPIETRANVAYFGTFGYELDLNLLSDAEIETVKKQIAFMKEHRELIQMDGDFYRLLSPFEGNETAWMVVSSDKTQAVAAFYQRLNKVNASWLRLKLDGLDANTKYEVSCDMAPVTSYDAKIAEAYGHKTEEDSVKTYQAYGDELMSAGIPIDREELNKKGGDFASLLYTLKKVDE